MIIEGCVAKSIRLRKERHHRYNQSPKGKQRSLNARIKAKQDVLEVYGKVCACCGESDVHFLCIDHIDNGRGNPAIRHGFGVTFYLWLKKNNYPKGFQTLCHNCNTAKALYGRCPHKN